jgi:hypothetical protein
MADDTYGRSQEYWRRIFIFSPFTDGTFFPVPADELDSDRKARGGAAEGEHQRPAREGPPLVRQEAVRVIQGRKRYDTR